jgi:metal-responsive CopG/Arc/MetJ family transcriptional regulator
MAKKVIQVPIDEELLVALNEMSRRQQKARAELIRRACLSYLKQIERAELDRLYQEGYERMPEKPESAETQVALVGEMLPEERW